MLSDREDRLLEVLADGPVQSKNGFRRLISLSLLTNMLKTVSMQNYLENVTGFGDIQ